MNKPTGNQFHTGDYYGVHAKQWRGGRWIRRENYIYSCKWCGQKMPTEKEGARQRIYCPRPKSCRELAYQKRKKSLVPSEEKI